MKIPYTETKNNSLQLIKIIQDKILARGKISFRDFMEMVLYERNLGYYTSGKKVWGKDGDYLTSSVIHPVFARLICRQLFEMWQIIGEPYEFTIIEAGAGSAGLLREIINYSEILSTKFFKAIQPVIVEKNPSVKERFPDFLWFSSLDEIKKPITGCIISNELIDALPVHIVINDSGIIKEVYVTLNQDGFAEVPDILSNPELKEYLKGIAVTNWQRIELNLEAVRYIKKASSLIKNGFVITIDYGLPEKEFYETFKNGSLLCYYKHRINNNPYTRIGLQDITSHVDFTGLARYGKKAGLEVTGFTTQFYFLLALGILEEFDTSYSMSIEALSKFEWNQKLKDLIMPGGMGSAFKVLIQHKLAPECLQQKGIAQPILKGFSYKDFKNEL